MLRLAILFLPRRYCARSFSQPCWSQPVAKSVFDF